MHTNKPQREKTTYANLVQMARQPRPRTRRMAVALAKIETLTQHDADTALYMLRFALSGIHRAVGEAANPALNDARTNRELRTALEDANRILRQQDETIFDLRARTLYRTTDGMLVTIPEN